MKTIPQSILDDLENIPGFDRDVFIQAHQHPAITSVRINPGKRLPLFDLNEQVPWCPAGRYLPQRPVFTLDPAYHAGAYYVQEASSMFLHYFLQNIIKDKIGLRVLDLCAAPGGKSTLIASLLDKESLLVANEVIRSRASILDENITRWGYMNTIVTCNDPRDFSKLEGYFDVIVVDAPCSGSGLFRKDEKALAEWSTDNVALCGQRQERILADILPALKQGGILIYATCSYSLREDEQILDWLAQEYLMSSVTVPIEKEWGIIEVSSSKHNMAGYRFMPGRVKGEGFFIAAMQKTSLGVAIYPQRFKTANDKKIQQQASYLLNGDDFVFLKTDPENFNALYACHEADYQMMHKLLYFRKAGIRLGQPGRKEWIPAHDIALSINSAKDLPFVDVARDEALQFLKKEDFSEETRCGGWHIVKYNGLGLGWVKLLGNRINNYLPKHWRIRMEIEL